jgi:hypothetical protein
MISDSDIDNALRGTPLLKQGTTTPSKNSGTSQKTIPR